MKNKTLSIVHVILLKQYIQESVDKDTFASNISNHGLLAHQRSTFSLLEG